MSDTSAVHGLPYIQAAQAQKHVTHNEALRVLDVLVQLSVEAQGTIPPGTPETGARYIVGTGGSGAWAGQDGAVALWEGTSWAFFTPQQGWLAWRRDTSVLTVFDGSVWVPYGTGMASSLPQFGINATPDAVNRFSVASDATLLSNAGAGHQVKINKADSDDTASLLFQTGFSGRAEMGTAGSDDFAIKVSMDGSTWSTALSIAADSGVPDLVAGATIDGQLAYARGNLLGTVSATGGQPTGAVIERGSNANGEYVRFADGTQICTSSLTTSGSGGVRWNYPLTFAASPHVTGSMSVTAAHFITTSGSGSGTSVTVNGWAHNGGRVASQTRLTAIGRWF
ncbi:DUF2793 domain-containing protein [Sulfitobacter sp. S190]|uniref:DUF2793 domain-containing protein n=1 Tax=Sulfitobacter sp. S190 TaxID=2867022 RepID=UPI0021A4C3C3|nr:DUF2793 domain-containing protein [Sulfitobacter sp. S190]UWR24418.1 DUF2793 domain-containing protein [Sulfitobacter sp. S190]